MEPSVSLTEYEIPSMLRSYSKSLQAIGTVLPARLVHDHIYLVQQAHAQIIR